LLNPKLKPGPRKRELKTDNFCKKQGLILKKIKHYLGNCR